MILCVPPAGMLTATVHISCSGPTAAYSLALPPRPRDDDAVCLSQLLTGVQRLGPAQPAQLQRDAHATYGCTGHFSAWCAPGALLLAADLHANADSDAVREVSDPHRNAACSAVEAAGERPTKEREHDRRVSAPAGICYARNRQGRCLPSALLLYNIIIICVLHA